MDMRRVRILTAVGGHACGELVTVPARDAATWVGRGDAEIVRETPRETATAEPAPERAVSTSRTTAGSGRRRR